MHFLLYNVNFFYYFITSGDKGKIEENVGKFVYESTKRVNCDYNTTMEKLCEDLDHDALMSAVRISIFMFELNDFNYVASLYIE